MERLATCVPAIARVYGSAGILGNREHSHNRRLHFGYGRRGSNPGSNHAILRPMNGLLETLPGLAWTAAINGPLVWGAILLAGRLPSSHGAADRAAAAIGLWVAGAILCGLGTATLGVFGRPGLLAASLAVAAVAGFATRGTTSMPWLAAFGRALKRRAAVHPWELLAGLPVMAVTVLAVAWAAGRPPFGFDAVNYHMALAWGFVHSGGLGPTDFPGWIGHFGWFPANGELWTAWWLAAAGSDLWIPFANLPFAALLVLATYGAARDLGVGRGGAASLAALVLSFPMTFRALPEPYVELAYWACLAGALRFALLAARPPAPACSGGGIVRPGAFAVAAVFGGLLVGTKPLGVVHLALVLGVMLAASTRLPARAWAVRAGVLAAAVLALGTAFYVRNLVLTGNPLYPMPLRIGGVEVFPGLADWADNLKRTVLWPHLGMLWTTGFLPEALVGTIEPPNGSWGFGAGGVLALALGVATTLALAVRAAMAPSRNRRRNLAIGIAGLLAAGFYLVLPWCGQFLQGNVRFAWPAALLLVLASGALAADLGVPDRVVAIAAFLLQAANLLFVRLPIDTPSLVLAAGLPLGVVAWILALRFAGRNRPVRVAGASFLLLLLAVGCAALLDPERADTAQAWRLAEGDTGPLPWARERADCVAAVQAGVPGGTLAVTLSRATWHAFPLGALIGRTGERRLVYVPIDTGPTPLFGPSPDRDPGVPGDADAWAGRIVEARPDALVVLSDPEDAVTGQVPPEGDWARNRPELFRPVASTPYCDVFLIRPR